MVTLLEFMNLLSHSTLKKKLIICFDIRKVKTKAQNKILGSFLRWTVKFLWNFLTYFLLQYRPWDRVRPLHKLSYVGPEYS